MSTVCEFPNTLAITSWLVIKAIKVVHTARVVQCSTVANTGKLKLKSNLASVRHGEIYGNLIGSHVYWWQWPWHYLVACFHIPNKHDQTIIFTAYSKQAQLEIVQTKRQYLKQILELMLSKQKKTMGSRDPAGRRTGLRSQIDHTKWNKWIAGAIFDLLK